jgi:hypothetical protein
MRTITCCLALLVMVGAAADPGPAPSPAGPAPTVTVGADGACLFRIPSASAVPKGHLVPGAILEVLSRSTVEGVAWLMVSTPDLGRGWVPLGPDGRPTNPPPPAKSPEPGGVGAKPPAPPPIPPADLERLKADAVATRVATIRKFGRLRSAAAVQPLVAVLSDAPWEARAEAAEALGRIGDRGASAPLCALLADRCFEVVGSAIRALTALRDPSVAPCVMEKMKILPLAFRPQACRLLAFLGDPAAVPVVEDVAKTFADITDDELRYEFGRIRSERRWIDDAKTTRAGLAADLSLLRGTAAPPNPRTFVVFPFKTDDRTFVGAGYVGGLLDALTDDEGRSPVDYLDPFYRGGEFVAHEVVAALAYDGYAHVAFAREGQAVSAGRLVASRPHAFVPEGKIEIVVTDPGGTALVRFVVDVNAPGEEDVPEAENRFAAGPRDARRWNASELAARLLGRNIAARLLEEFGIGSPGGPRPRTPGDPDF